MNIPDALRAKLRELPDKPGCYIMRDRRGTIIYVGKAVSLRKRVQSYFRAAALRRGDPKLRGLVHSVSDLEWIVTRNEAQALLTEGQLIKDYKPRYNVDLRDDKRFLMVRIDLGEPFPKFTVCRIRRDDGCTYFGPYASSPAARATLDFVEKQFGIRKCAPRIPDADTHRHCLDDIIRQCSAPCVGSVSAEEYRRRVDEACAFLRGERQDLLKGLRARMEEAAAAFDFEKAAALRDTLHHLVQTARRQARVSGTPELLREAAQAGVDELAAVLGLPVRPETIECFDISGISGTLCVASLVCAVGGRPQRQRYRHFRIKSEDAFDDTARMAEVVRRRYGRLQAEGQAMPDLVLVDGGPTQVAAAVRVLGELGLEALPVAGLAKKQEEIFLPGRAQPVRLPRDSRGLQVLQRLRDEAHRFALAHHQRLRRRRIRESLLDEIPGVGPEKKAVLLRRFGSVRRLARASADDLAGVPGIGHALAAEILARLAPAGVNA